MKTLLFSFALVFFTLTTNAQSAKTPQDVKDSFSEKYSDVTDVTWEKKGNDFVANYVNKNNKDVKAFFEADGTWLETKTFITGKDLPTSVLGKLATSYDEYEFEDVLIIENSDGEFYYYVVINDGEESIELKYNQKGTLIP